MPRMQKPHHDERSSADRRTLPNAIFRVCNIRAAIRRNLICRMTHSRRRDRLPTAFETDTVLAQASPPFRLIYAALRQCGARPGELCRATIADVDRVGRLITLKEHKTARKTGQPRRIPIGRKLAELLDQAIGTKICREKGIEFARRLLGHAHISTTQRYMHLDDRELADAQDLVE